MTEEGLTSEELHTWRTFLRSHATVTRRLEAELVAEHDLPLASYDVLVQLSEAPDRRLRMVELADAVLLSRSGLTRLVDRMEAEGYVRREPSPDDARGIFAVMTDKGFTTLRAASRTHLAGVSEHVIDRLTPSELAGLGVACLKLLSENVRPGVTTGDLDRLAEEFICDRGGKPEFKGYQGFPASICASPNAMIVHGIPGSYRLEEGDIISLDVGVRYEGFVTDSATTVPVGEVPEKVVGLLETTRECLAAATEQMRAGNRLGDVGYAIQSLAESRGYGVVRDLISHGVGRQMHEDPQIPNYGNPGTGTRLLPGMTFAIEPMITLGDYGIVLDEEDHWSIYTSDGSLSAHFEHTIAVTENGPWVLTTDGGPAG